eukprot:2129385-Pleurochrysis_carterae.AAC.1
MEFLRDCNDFGFELLHTLIVCGPYGMTRPFMPNVDKCMACGQTEESMIPFDSAQGTRTFLSMEHIASKKNKDCSS